MKDIKVSLIMCTLNRVNEIKSLMQSLKRQTYKNFELIFVDQNEDNRVNSLINEYKEFFDIKHIKSEKGLSKGRNYGLKFCEGEIVAFPDDDCYYDDNVLENVVKFFSQNREIDILSIKMTNSNVYGRKINEGVKSQKIDKDNIFSLVASISIFITSKVIKEVDGFDENLGLGADTIFQGGEDYDYPLTALSKGFKAYYKNDIVVYHPWDDAKIDKRKDLLKNAFNGGASEFYLLNKHNYSQFFKIKRLFRRVIIIIYYMFKLNFYKVKQSYMILKGMIKYYNYEEVRK